MNIVQKLSGIGSGYNVATRAYKDRWGVSMGVPAVKNWHLADASTPSPNMRASELSLQLAMAVQFPETNLVSFMGYGGTLGEYQYLWPASAVDDSRWREFYAPYMRNMGKIFGGFAPAALLGPVHEERATLLTDLGTSIGVANVGLVLPLEKSFNMSLENIGWYGDSALGKIPCPDCSNQRGVVIYHPIRYSNGAYVLCRNEHATKESGCKGAKAWKEQQAWQIPIAELVKLIGIRLSGKAVYQLLRNSSLARNSALLVRDYSMSRGTVEQIIAQYPTDQVGITTALNIKKGDGDASGYDLEAAMSAQPAEWANLLRDFQVFSQGKIWDIYLD